MKLKARQPIVDMGSRDLESFHLNFSNILAQGSLFLEHLMAQMAALAPTITSHFRQQEGTLRRVCSLFLRTLPEITHKSQLIH